MRDKIALMSIDSNRAEVLKQLREGWRRNEWYTADDMHELTSIQNKSSVITILAKLHDDGLARRREYNSPSFQFCYSISKKGRFILEIDGSITVNELMSFYYAAR